MDSNIKKLNEDAKKYSEKLQKVSDEIKKVIVGQEDIIDKVLLCVSAEGHALLEGVPGLAKTMLVKTLSDSLNTTFHRIQFTPDLLPADIVGTKIYDNHKGTFATKKGPLFANIILADEINRAPPKVQSALLEAMQEKQITISGDTFELELPFLVLATQNPIETEGTYRLPEAQLDRFMFKILFDYPDIADSKIIIERMTNPFDPKVKKILEPKEIIELQKFVKTVYVDDKITDYVTKLVDATRNPKTYKLEIKHLIDFGASPRALIWLIMAAKANAVLNGRGYVIPEDIKFVAHDVLRHRILLSYEAEAEGITSDAIIDMILEKIKTP
ncbi:MAG: MoxR family ATPase [Candidatus Woesearchaeota archaeon]|jgi:MoxR-like ATPase